ncbi:HAMP domain-containing histidine kinase [Candidatus Woesebacteria bacterium]|nr:MAG: HAMP domain-containing histidine kinase [Candidatus Woesebacteria bacterium]
MFNLARLKLTAWYVVILMFVSLLFSISIYGNVSRQIERFTRAQNDRLRDFQFERFENAPPRPMGLPPTISSEELKYQKKQLVVSLALINMAILAVAGGASYFLSGKTLKPIGKMIGEQNQFISDASHELRTPIATLKAEMEAALLENNLTKESAKSLIKSNLEEINDINILVNSLLHLTKVHHEKTSEGHVKHFIGDDISSAIRKLTTQATVKSIKLIDNVPRVKVLGNPDELKELFVIIIDNAIKYSKSNTKVSIKGERNKDNINVKITDQGIGISKSDLPKIFDRFYRAEKSRSETEGFGLGLAIAKSIVVNHRGTIKAESKPGKGTSICVELPLISSN